MTAKAKIWAFVTTAGIGGLGVFLWAALSYRPHDLFRFFCYLALAGMASRMKVRLPGVTGTMSVNFVFILLGVLEMDRLETLAIGCFAGLLQCIWNANKRPSFQQIVFNVGSMAVAIQASFSVYHFIHDVPLHISGPLPLALSAAVLFVANTLPVAMIISATEGKPLRKLWSECYFWAFPCYLVGAGVSGLFDAISHAWGWQSTLLVLPLVYWIYHSYRLYLERLEREKTHAEEMSKLHLRTIEALALAIDAKDHTTQEHLSRVQVYAMEIGKDMGLNENELEALRAASLLHDIGKLAVPEHIIAKPGRLTPEEFDKMKIHPLVGAEILNACNFRIPWYRSCGAITKNGMAADIRKVCAAKKFPSARGFSRWSIASMRWRPIASIAARCRSTKRWKRSFSMPARALIRKLWACCSAVIWNSSKRRATSAWMSTGSARM